MLPHVTCVMTAFNYERYIAGALRSVITQDYPPDRLDVVVVDDGSTDGTSDVVRAMQAEAPARITLVQQENAGLAGATDTALKHARGELVAICDADDEWLPGKVRAQADVFLARPEVSCVYGDMLVVDEAGEVLDRSFFTREQLRPARGRVLEALLDLNFTTNSTLMLRAGSAPSIPVGSPYADYWLVTHAAAAGELELIERPLASYRLHAANMSFGAEGAHRGRELRRELAIRRMLLRSDVRYALPADTLIRLVREYAQKAVWISHTTGIALTELLPVASDERARATDVLAERARVRTRDDRARAAADAWLLDPFNPAAAHALEDPAGGAPGTPRLTLADATELLTHPELLAGYCARVSPDDDATLVILTPDAELEDVAEQLRDVLSAAGIDPANCADLQIVPRSRWVDDQAASSSARLGVMSES